MGAKFFTSGALPVRMKILGDNIEHLYHAGCRTAVNCELVGHKVEGIHVQFGADEYGQIVVTFTNKFGTESDKFVIRARKLAKVVESINEAYAILTNKSFTTMRKIEKKTVAETTVVSNEVSNATIVVSDNRSDSAEADDYNLTLKMTQSVEKIVKKYPDNWLWFQHRWNTPYEEVMAKEQDSSEK